MIAQTLEGIPGKEGSPEPTIPAINPASPPMHTHATPFPTSQFAVLDQPTSPCFLFPRIRTSENERGHHSSALFVRPSVCFARHSGRLFSFPLLLPFPTWLAALAYSTFIRADCFTLLRAQFRPHDSPRPTL